MIGLQGTVKSGGRTEKWLSTYRRSWIGFASRVELYEGSGGTEGTTLRDTGLPVIIVTNRGNRTGAIRKTPLMRVREGNKYVLVGSKGGAPNNPEWVYNLRADGNVEDSGRDRGVRDAGPRSCGCGGTGAFVGTGSGGVSTIRRISDSDGAENPVVRC